MTIKYNWRDLAKRIINGREVEKVIYNWTQIRPSQSPSAGIYHNATLWLLSYSVNWTNWITIADKDLWASALYWQWYIYQRGNNHWFTISNYSDSISTTRVNASQYSWDNPYSSSTFIIPSSSEKWDSSNNHDLWGDPTDTLIARRWPCPEWYHVPTSSDFLDILNVLTSFLWTMSVSSVSQYLYFSRHSSIEIYNNTPVVSQYYWTWLSSWDSSTRVIYISAIADIGYNDSKYTINWLPIRPFKNTPVIPDSTWTKLL